MGGEDSNTGKVYCEEYIEEVDYGSSSIVEEGHHKRILVTLIVIRIKNALFMTKKLSIITKYHQVY